MQVYFWVVAMAIYGYNLQYFNNFNFIGRLRVWGRKTIIYKMLFKDDTNIRIKLQIAFKSILFYKKIVMGIPYGYQCQLAYF
jgi:hypothetical protein